MNGWNDQEIKDALSALFRDARENGGLDFVYTLLRLEGMTFEKRDRLLELRDSLSFDANKTSAADLGERYCSILEFTEPLSVLANLVRCAGNQPFQIWPFSHMQKGKFPNAIGPTQSEVAADLARKVAESGRDDLSVLIGRMYRPETLADCHQEIGALSEEEFLTRVEILQAFLGNFLETYFDERLRFRDELTLYKAPNFGVIELLVNDAGLFGVRHFHSNGSSSQFVRNEGSTICENMILDNEPGLMVGSLDDLKPEYWVGDKRLYEIGLPGHYNEPGCWKPIIYPGKTEAIQQEISRISDDPEVQGSLFYMYCTGHRAIEFVIRTPIELPGQHHRIGENIHIYICPKLESDPHSDQNVTLYDGWIELESATPEEIKRAIATIGILVNRLAFAYETHAEWRLKYSMIVRPTFTAKPTDDDLKLVDRYLLEFLETDDSIILDAALDWYVRGRGARNIFLSYFCYFVAMERVALAVADDRADLSLRYHAQTKDERDTQQKECIREKYDALYETNPEEFVREAYFDCVVGITRKLREVVALVFGSDHEYISALFIKKDGYSLNDLRGRIAHGNFSQLDPEDEKLIRERLPEIAQISREFLTRIIFSLSPSDELPTWSRKHSYTMQSVDPRNTLVASTEKIMPETDWRIRPEWFD